MLIDLDVYEVCEFFSWKYNKKEAKRETENKYIARKLGMSDKNARRYIIFTKCLPKVQKLFKSNILTMSCMDYIGDKSQEKQSQMYKVIIDAIKDDVIPSRDGLIKLLSKNIEINPYIEWDELKLIINPEKKRKKENTKQKDLDSTVAQGDRFTEMIVNLMYQNGYPIADKNKKISADFKADAFARDEKNNTYALQFKYHSKQNEGMIGVCQAALGKINYERDYAVTVTSTKFSKPAQEYAKKLGVILWDGDYLREHFGWNGKI